MNLQHFPLSRARGCALALLLFLGPAAFARGSADTSFCRKAGCLRAGRVETLPRSHSEVLPKAQAECTQFSPQAESFPKPLFEATRDVLVLYFDEPRDDLGLEELEAIESWVQKHAAARGFSVDGYADPCGNSDGNQVLSESRAQKVGEILDLAFQAHLTDPHGVPVPPIQTRGHGETDAWTHHEIFRRVEIRPWGADPILPPQLRSLVKAAQVGQCLRPEPPSISPQVSRALSHFHSDVLLIDQSSSMLPHWRTIQTHPQTKKARLWFSTTEHPGEAPIDLADAKPEGSTEIFRSLYTLLLNKKVRVGETVVILSDFDSNHPLTREGAEVIRALAQKLGVKVCGIDVRTGLPYDPERPGGSRRQDGLFNFWAGMNTCRKTL